MICRVLLVVACVSSLFAQVEQRAATGQLTVTATVVPSVTLTFEGSPEIAGANVADPMETFSHRLNEHILTEEMRKLLRLPIGMGRTQLGLENVVNDTELTLAHKDFAINADD